MNNKIMEQTRLPKRSRIPILIGIFSFLICLFTNANARNAKKPASKNSSTILQKIKEFCKQRTSKKSKKNESLDDLALDQLQQGETDDCFSTPTKKIKRRIPLEVCFQGKLWHNQ